MSRGAGGDRLTDQSPRLGIDTATPYLAVALWWPGAERIARAAWRLDRRLAAELAPRVDGFLLEHGVAPSDLGGIGVGVGPGSFTGARVGVAWAQGVRRGIGLSLVGGDTLAARAWATCPEGGRCTVAVEGRRGQAWCRTWMRAQGSLTPIGPAWAAAIAELPDEVARSLERPPDASWHARLVDDPASLAPSVAYGATDPA